MYASALTAYTSPNVSTAPEYILDPLSDTAAICLTDISYIPNLPIQSTNHPTSIWYHTPSQPSPNPYCKCLPDTCVHMVEDILHLFSCPTHSPDILHKLSSIWCHPLSPLKPALGTNWPYWLINLHEGHTLLDTFWFIYGTLRISHIHSTSALTSLTSSTVSKIFQNALFHMQLTLYSPI